MERLPYIHEAVDSVLDQIQKSDEVILTVDHNPELFRRLKTELGQKAKLVLNDGEERGAVATDNVGIMCSSGDIIALMDDDAIAAKDWLGNLIKHYQDPSVVAVGGRLVSVWDKNRPKWFPEELDWIVGSTYKGHPEIHTQVRTLIMCNMSVRKEGFQSVGFFTTDLGRHKNWGTGAESEFFLRIKHQLPDSIILYEPNAVVYHRVSHQRARLKYVLLRSYNEGFHKAIIQRTCANLSQNPLSTESSYLRYLLLTAIPEKLKHFYEKGNLAQAGAILITIVATGVGYLVGRKGKRVKR